MKTEQGEKSKGGLLASDRSDGEAVDSELSPKDDLEARRRTRWRSWESGGAP